MDSMVWLKSHTFMNINIYIYIYRYSMDSMVLLKPHSFMNVYRRYSIIVAYRKCGGGGKLSFQNVGGGGKGAYNIVTFQV